MSNVWEAEFEQITAFAGHALCYATCMSYSEHLLWTWHHFLEPPIHNKRGSLPVTRYADLGTKTRDRERTKRKKEDMVK